MFLIIGLGNPGKEYENTRHNVGRAIVEAFRKKIGADDFSFNKKFNARVSEKRIGKEKLTLILPETFMNKSGNAVGPAARFYKAKPKDVFVIHDDADIELGRAKLSFGKRSAGHKGVESAKRALGTWDFWRFRIGIQKKKRVPADKLVLQKFSPDEKNKLNKVVKKTVAAMEAAVREGPEAAMNEYNKN